MLEYETTDVTPWFFYECDRRLLLVSTRIRRAGRGQATNASTVFTVVMRCSIIQTLALFEMVSRRLVMRKGKVWGVKTLLYQ